MKRKATAQWQGNLKDGSGQISTETGVLSSVPYSFSTRFENQKGTNPEELVAAAHASCFSMALSGELQKMGFPPEAIQTNATVTLERAQAGWSITEVNLEVSARVLRIADSQFMIAAQAAKANCPISKLLKAKITVEAKLMSEENLDSSHQKVSGF